jgi:hypothetical protein
MGLPSIIGRTGRESAKKAPASPIRWHAPAKGLRALLPTRTIIRRDMAMEVVSGDDEDRRRNLVIKRREYAQARIAEYGMVDPQEEQITVLRLLGKRYVVHGEFRKGDIATSHYLRGFNIDVAAALTPHLRAVAKKTGKKTEVGRSRVVARTGNGGPLQEQIGPFVDRCLDAARPLGSIAAPHRRFQGCHALTQLHDLFL